MDVKIAHANGWAEFAASNISGRIGIATRPAASICRAEESCGAGEIRAESDAAHTPQTAGLKELLESAAYASWSISEPSEPAAFAAEPVVLPGWLPSKLEAEE